METDIPIFHMAKNTLETNSCIDNDENSADVRKSRIPHFSTDWRMTIVLAAHSTENIVIASCLTYMIGLT